MLFIKKKKSFLLKLSITIFLHIFLERFIRNISDIWLLLNMFYESMNPILGKDPTQMNESIRFVHETDIASGH